MQNTTYLVRMPGNECIVKLLDEYLSMLPPDAPYFYMRVLENVFSDHNKSSVTKQRVGINTLKGGSLIYLRCLE